MNFFNHILSYILILINISYISHYISIFISFFQGTKDASNCCWLLLLCKIALALDCGCSHCYCGCCWLVLLLLLLGGFISFGFGFGLFSRVGATQVGIIKCARHSLLADKFLAFPVGSGGSNTRQSPAGHLSWPKQEVGSKQWGVSRGELRGEGGQLSGQIMLVAQSKWPSRHTLEFECVTI